MTIKDYVNFYNKNSKILNTEKSFVFLDHLIISLRKIKKEEKTLDLIPIIDYNNNEVFYVNPQEAQSVLDDCYQTYYYNFFVAKYDSCKKIIELISIKIPDEYDIDKNFLSLVYFKLIILSLRYSVRLISNSFGYENFFLIMKKNFKNMFKIEDSSIDETVLEVIEGLINDNFLSEKNNELFLVDDYIRLDLIGLSLLPVKIDNTEGSLKYSCYYGLSSLYNVSYNYLSTTNIEEYKKYLLNKYSNNIEKFFLLENNLEDYENLEFSKFYMFNDDNYDYIMLCKIYVDKLILNEYHFHTIINCCFKEYCYSSNRNNILYGRSYDLAWRLMP